MKKVALQRLRRWALESMDYVQGLDPQGFKEETGGGVYSSLHSSGHRPNLPEALVCTKPSSHQSAEAIREMTRTPASSNPEEAGDRNRQVEQASPAMRSAKLRNLGALYRPSSQASLSRVAHLHFREQSDLFANAKQFE